MRKKIIILSTIIILIASTAVYSLEFAPRDYVDKNLFSKFNFKKEVTISIVGDVMFHSPQINSAYNSDKNEFDFRPNFMHIKKYIEESDYAVANFETTTSSNRNFSGFPKFNAPKESIEALKFAGFDMLLTANNHILDSNTSGLIETLDTISKNKMESIGTSFKNKYKSHVIKNFDGLKVGFLNYTYAVNGLSPLLKNNENVNVNFIKEEKIIEDIKIIKDNSDFIIVFLHWGDEYQTTPNKAQVKLANNLFDNGADIIIGSHPHVIQRSEIKDNNKFIIYSMGNFLSNQRRETLKRSNAKLTEDGLILDLTLEKNNYTNDLSIKNVNYIYTWVNRYKEKGKYRYEILPVEETLLKGEYNKNIFRKLKQSKENSKDKLEKMKINLFKEVPSSFTLKERTTILKPIWE